ncbi:hypothetical protein Gasu2_03300 [Galdieria sulphuraria]|nr:hypothetical protein Gasu2_03300 [Galdieria sulphuraria]
MLQPKHFAANPPFLPPASIPKKYLKIFLADKQKICCWNIGPVVLNVGYFIRNLAKEKLCILLKKIEVFNEKNDFEELSSCLKGKPKT